MKVLIVAKTRIRGGASVGAITFEGQSVRLIAPEQDHLDHLNLEYEIGDAWELDAAAPEGLRPPHVENVVVRSKRLMRRVELSRVIGFIEKMMPPATGSPDTLFDGFLHRAPGGPLYVAAPAVPGRSTMFWRPDRDLQRDEEGRRIRYRYPMDDGGRTLTFVGFQEPLAVIPAGTLLCVSLAHWWRPADKPEHEPRCYVQLSGWYDAGEGKPKRGSPGADRETAASAAPAPADAQLAAARELLKSVYGYDDFLPLQEQVIANVLARRDTLAIMPTGGGKSLCYQLPALLFPGLTLVISPLIALMQDQVDALTATGVPAAFLNSTVDYKTYVETTNAVRAGQIKLLYMAPETLLRPETLVMLDKSNVDCITIDEAHCISSWGHDFRPEYRQLLPLRKRYPNAVCLALTATATERVRDDIKQVLGLGEGNAFVASFNRPNLFLSAQQRTARLPQITAFLQAHHDQSGIIYTNKRKDAEGLAEQLTALGFAALPYHAGMEDALRREHQRRFTRDEAQIIVATIAFGMGINKSNVRFILHAALPENLENYYQQVGRAGRDGLRADCLLLWSYADAKIIRKFISEAAPEEQPGREARLRAMLRYAEWTGCRRAPLLAYFGETVRGNCAGCDNCIGGEPAGETSPPAAPRAWGAGHGTTAPATDQPEDAAELFEELRKLRLQLARAAHLPPFVIFSDRTLQEMAQKRPQTDAALRGVSGVGEKKLATYGPQFIETITAYCAAHPPTGDRQPAPAPQAEQMDESERRNEVAALYGSGVSVEAVARLFGVKTGTILTALVTHHGEGHPVDGAGLLPYVKAAPELQGDALALFGELGARPLKPVYEALGGQVSYEDLRLLRIYYEAQTKTGRQDAT